MKWALLILFLMGCTSVYVTGDNNDIDLTESASGDADIEGGKKKD